MGTFTRNIHHQAAGRPTEEELRTMLKTKAQAKKDLIDKEMKANGSFLLAIKRPWWKFWQQRSFIHFFGYSGKGQSEYRAVRGLFSKHSRAALFTKKAAQTFIDETKAANLVMIQIDKTILQ